MALISTASRVTIPALVISTSSKVTSYHVASSPSVSAAVVTKVADNEGGSSSSWSCVLPVLAVAGAGYLGYRLYKRWSLERAAKKEIALFDKSDALVSDGNVLVVQAAGRSVTTRKRCRKYAADAYALQAYLKFGRRQKSEANVLVTRKYISDLLIETPDMRTRDKIEIMDKAVFLSFLPSKTHQECAAFETTFAYANRVLGKWEDL
jgi:hypothetical protein